MRRFWHLAFVLILAIFSNGCAHASDSVPKFTTAETLPMEGLVVEQLEGPLLEVHFIDVKQGDSILIRTPTNKNFLIDVGPTTARKTLPPYLKELGITELDALLITHSHSDHMGSLLHLMDAVKIKHVYSSGFFHDSKHNLKCLERIKKEGIPMTAIRRGEELVLDRGVHALTLHPPTQWKEIGHDANNSSVIWRLSYGDMDFLLTGDAEVKAEKEMMKAKVELRSEFLKLGHHGSRTATSAPFLNQVNPRFAVISCGVGNKFAHPHEETLTALKARDIVILRTDKDGTIVVATNGKKVMIKTNGKTWTPVSSLYPILPEASRWLIFARGGLHAC